MNTTAPPRHERDILQDAAAAIAEHDRHYSAMRDLDERIAALCREFGEAKRMYGYAPHHLRKSCAAQGLLS